MLPHSLKDIMKPDPDMIACAHCNELGLCIVCQLSMSYIEQNRGILQISFHRWRLTKTSMAVACL